MRGNSIEVHGEEQVYEVETEYNTNLYKERYISNVALGWKENYFRS